MIIDKFKLLDNVGREYQIIYADPPWTYRDKALAGNRGACCKYNLMTQDEIIALPVKEITAANSVLFIWVTLPKINEVFDVVTAWGFTYKTNAFTWVKRNKRSDGWFWGMGRWTRANAELCLLATKGNPQRINAGVHSVVDTPIEGHSKKPDVVRDRIIQLCGSVKRIELFARQRVDGWDSWGNEVAVSQIASATAVAGGSSE